MPRSSNGIETDPITFFHVIETIARADASTAWCLSQAGGCAMSAAYLDLPVAKEIFGDDPRAVLAWGPGPRVEGHRVRGRLQGHRRVGLRLGLPARDLARRALPDLAGRRHAASSGPTAASSSAPCWCASGEVEWTDIWNTVGLRGTASDQFALTDHFVPADHSITRDVITRESAKECREPGPLYRMSAMTCYEVGFAGVALGIARGCARQLRRHGAEQDPARRKEARSATVPWCRPTSPRPRSASARRAPSCCSRWPRSGSGSRPATELSVEHRITIRMASTNAIHKAREAVDFAYNAAGATAIFESHPLERRFRDIHTVTQQLQGRLSHFETVGAWMMGADADLTFV